MMHNERLAAPSGRLARSLLGVGLVLALGAAPARAQNLVENADFDTNLVGWFESFSFVLYGWNALDRSGSPVSGSARQENVAEGPNLTSGIGQCIPVTGGETYVFGGSTYVPSGQSATGRAGVTIQFRETPDCTGPGIGARVGFTGTNSLFDAWFDFVSEEATAPAEARSLQLDLDSRKIDAGGSFVAFWDHLFVVPEPGAGALAAGAVSVLACLARRRGACAGSRARPPVSA